MLILYDPKLTIEHVDRQVEFAPNIYRGKTFRLQIGQSRGDPVLGQATHYRLSERGDDGTERVIFDGKVVGADASDASIAGIICHLARDCEQSDPTVYRDWAHANGRTIIGLALDGQWTDFSDGDCVMHL